MADLIKTQRLMRFSWATRERTAFEAAVDPGDAVEVGLAISRSVWEDLGCPSVVTVTVERGDTLNEPKEPK